VEQFQRLIALNSCFPIRLCSQ